jgi:hypothetical protein
VAITRSNGRSACSRRPSFTADSPQDAYLSGNANRWRHWCQREARNGKFPRKDPNFRTSVSHWKSSIGGLTVVMRGSTVARRPSSVEPTTSVRNHCGTRATVTSQPASAK